MVFVLALGIGTWTWAGDAPSPALPAAPAAFDTVESWAESLPVAPVKTLALVDPADVTTTTGSPADRAQLIRPALVRAGDRTSFALQMTAEPRKAALRVLSARALALEVGPVAGPLHAQELAPGTGMPFLRHVSVRPTPASNGQVLLRARLTFDVPTRGNVRVAGRTVFVDLQPMADRVEQAGRVLSDPPKPRTMRPPVAILSAATYRQNLRPLLARLHEIKPFLLSAASAPTDSVLDAVGRTMTAVEAPLHVMDVPPDARTSHNVLVSAVAMASRAVARDFTGDRVTEAQRAFALIDSTDVQ